jgi:hypothetical protein
MADRKVEQQHKEPFSMCRASGNGSCFIYLICIFAHFLEKNPIIRGKSTIFAADFNEKKICLIWKNSEIFLLRT